MAAPVPGEHTADERVLLRAAKRFRLTLGFGIAFAVLGASYGVFAAAQFGKPGVHEAFDRPIARMALVVQSCGAERRRFEPGTEREAMLLRDVEQHAFTSGHLVVLLIRGLIASMLFSAGLAGIAAGAAEARLLRAFAGVGADFGARRDTAL